MEQNLDKDELMERIKQALKSEIVPIIFDTTIQPLIIEQIDNSNIVFQCDGNYIKDLLENRYASLISHTIKVITNKNYTFSVHSLEEDSDIENMQEQKVSELPKPKIHSNIAPRFKP